MTLTGGCYCGEVRYKVTSRPLLSAQCHCRPCQYISGGGPNYFMLVGPESFSYTGGEVRSFKRRDLENGVTREFCGICGTHVLTGRPDLPQLVLKAGTLDDPAAYGAPGMAIFCAEMAPFHVVPDNVPAFEGMPARNQQRRE